MPLFEEPYKTTNRDELSRQIQNILGDYEVMKELWRSMSCTQCPNGSEDSQGKPKYPSFHDRESLESNSCCAHIYHKLFCTSSARGSPFVGNISHSSKMAPPRMEPVPSLHAKNYGPPYKQHLTRDRLSQEGHSSNHKKCDRRADGDSAPGKKLSPLISPVSHLPPVQSRLPRTSKVYSNKSSKELKVKVQDKETPLDRSSKDLKVKVQDNEPPLASSVVITRLGVASSQTFPLPPLPSESVATQQKPMTRIWPTDGQNQAPSESLGLKPPLKDNGQQSFEKPDVKVPAKAKLTRLKISSQSESVEQLFSNEVRCIEEILKEMTHSWLPPLTAKHKPSTAKTKHTPSTAKSTRSPFPTKEPLPNSSATQSQNQYDPPSKIYPNSQQRTSTLREDLQLSDSEESYTEQTAEKLPSLSAPPSAPQNLPKPDPNSQQGTSILWEDLQLSDSEESDTEQAAEKLPSLSAPPSAPQNLPKPDPNSQQGTSILWEDLQVSDSEESYTEQAAEKLPSLSAPPSAPQNLPKPDPNSQQGTSILWEDLQVSDTEESNTEQAAEKLPSLSAPPSAPQNLPKPDPNSQQGTSILWEDLQVSDSEESDTEQAAEKLPSLSAPPSAPQNLPKPDPNSQQGTSILWEDLQVSDTEESDTEQAAEKLPSLSAPPSAPQNLPKPDPNSQQGTSILWEDLQVSDTEESDTEQAAEKLPSLSAPPSAPQNLPKPDPNSQQGTSILWKDLQVSDTEESDTEQAAEKLPSLSAPPSAPQILPKPVVSAHSSSAKSENKGENRNTDQLHPESKGSPPKSSSKAVQDPTEGPQPEERSCQKSPAQQESPPQQTIETKQPRKPAKGSGQAEPQACLQVDSQPGPLPSESKKQTSKDKPEMKAKGRESKPEACMPNHQAAEPAPKEKRKHKGSPAPSKVPSGPQPPKDKALNSGRGCSGGSSGRSSDCQQTASVREDGQKRDTQLLSPLRDSPLPPSLVVKTNLDHLTRIPQPLGKGGSPRKAEDRQPPADKKQDSEKRDCNGSSRLSQKRKGSDSEKDRASKKIRREKDVQSHCTSSSSSHTESSKTKTSKMPSLPPVSASSSSQKSTKTAGEKPKPDVDTCGQDPPKSAGSANANDKDSSVPKPRKVPKVQAKGSEYKGSSREATNALLVPSLPKGNCKAGKPQVEPYMQKADFYMKEAQRLKCKAAAKTDKIKKAFKYLEAVLSLIECGMAMESESSVEAAYAVYSETADLIKFTMSLKSFSDATVPAQEQIFDVLCLRCQSLVNMAMFRCKKDIVMKYSHSLSDHFNNSSLCTGIPSSLSPVPSPARSVRSQSSAGGMTATVSVPVTIQNKTFAYFTITNHLLKALELWEQSEALTNENKKFFAQLSTKVRILTLNSSLVDLVIYTRQGLQRLKQTLKTP